MFPLRKFTFQSIGACLINVLLIVNKREQSTYIPQKNKNKKQKTKTNKNKQTIYLDIT